MFNNDCSWVKADFSTISIRSSPRFQKMSDFYKRCYANSIIPAINESCFTSVKKLKAFRSCVYGQLRAIKDSSIFFSHFQKAKKQLVKEVGARKILDLWCKYNGVIVLNSKNDANFGHYRSFFPDWKYCSPWYMNAVKVPDPNFGVVCILGHLKAVEILLKKDPLLAANFFTAKGSSAFDCAVMSCNSKLIRLIYELGGRPKLTNPFANAIRDGNLELLMLLIRECPDLKVDWSEHNVFPLAALFGELEVLNFLLTQGVNIDSTNGQNETALHLACRSHLNHVVAFLLEHQASTQIKNENGETPLHIACCVHNHEALSVLITHRNKELFAEDANYYAVLFNVCKRGDLSLVKVMVCDSLLRDKKGPTGNSLVHNAVESRNVELVEFLYQSKFSIDEKDNKGATPLHYACSRDDQKMVLFLLQAGADLKAEDKLGNTALFYATSIAMTKLLLEKGADINHQRSCDGFTKLMACICLMRSEEYSLDLLTFGADWKLVDHNQRNALIYALSNGYQTVVRKMLEQGGKATLEAPHTSFALCHAISREGITDNTKLLLSKGADPNHLLDGNDRCPATMVIGSSKSEEEKIAILDFLFEAGADIDIEINSVGPVLLMQATMLGHHKVCCYLLEKGISVKNDKNCYSLNSALISRNFPLAQLMLKCGALTEPSVSEVTTPIQCALIAQSEVIALDLIERGVNIHQAVNQMTSLKWAALNGMENVVHKLVEKGAIIDAEVINFAITPPESIVSIFANFPENMRICMQHASNENLEENKRAVFEFLLSNLNPKDQELTDCLELAFIVEAPFSYIHLLIRHGADLSQLKSSRKKAIWISVFISGRVDLYTCLNRLIECDLSLFEKLSCLREPNCKDLLNEVLHKEGKDLFLLEKKQLESLIPDNPLIIEAYSAYDQGFFEILKCLKRVAHSFALVRKTTLASKKISLSGANKYLSAELAKTFKLYLASYKGDYSEENLVCLAQAISSLELKIDGRVLENELNSGKAIALTTGFTKHCMGIVCFKHPETKKLHILIENRGAGTDTDYIGLSEIIFEQKGPLGDFFNQINKNYGALIDLQGQVCEVNDIDAFWKLLETVGANRKEATLLMQQYPQQDGTCTHDNTKGSIGGLFYAQAMLKGCSRKESIAAMVQQYKSFTAFERNETLSSALNIFNPETYPAHMEFDSQFFKDLYNKVLKDKRIAKPLVKKLKKTIQSFALRDIAKD